MSNNNFPNQNNSANNNNTKEFYNTSSLRNNVIAELCNEITANEIIDINVEKVKLFLIKYLVEMGENFVENILENACLFAKHKQSDCLTVGDIKFAMEKNFDINIPTKAYDNNKIKSNEIRNYSTLDHKKRVELTREECKNIN